MGFLSNSLRTSLLGLIPCAEFQRANITFPRHLHIHISVFTSSPENSGPSSVVAVLLPSLRSSSLLGRSGLCRLAGAGRSNSRDSSWSTDQSIYLKNALLVESRFLICLGGGWEVNDVFCDLSGDACECLGGGDGVCGVDAGCDVGLLDCEAT